MTRFFLGGGRWRGAIAATMLLGLAPPAMANPVQEVDQITDSSAGSAARMYRFSPSLIYLRPGEGLAFLNSKSAHTVHSIPALWNSDQPKIAISNRPRAEIRFDAPGLYGLRCARHGLYGMVMLVVVGKLPDTTAVRATLLEMRASNLERQALLDLLEQAEERQN